MTTGGLAWLKLDHSQLYLIYGMTKVHRQIISKGESPTDVAQLPLGAIG